MKEKNLLLLSPITNRLPKPIAEFLKLHQYEVLLCCTLLLALILRVYNFENRWGLGSDDLRDAMIGREALARGEFPLIGSFSSAGPFVFGPLFYWFIMFSYIIFPFSITAPWIMLVIVGVITVYILSLCGKRIEGKKLGILTAFFAAISPQLITRSIALNQHSLIAITTSLLLLFFILLWQKKQLRFAFLMGLSLGTAISLHYQALNLFIFLPVILVIPTLPLKKRMIAFLLMIAGISLPSLPLAIWDSRQEWANIRNLLDYMLIAQYRIYVPNSWTLFLFTYFPNYWSYVIGGFQHIGMFLMLFSIGVFLITLLKRQISFLLFTIAGMFAIIAIANRYYRGERFEGYLIYFLPFIILLTAWAVAYVLTLAKEKKHAVVRTVGFLLGLTILFASIYGDVYLIVTSVYAGIKPTKQVYAMVKKLQQRYPNTTFAVYDYKWQSSDRSYPLTAFLKEKDLTTKNGYPIGMLWHQADDPKKYTVLGKIAEEYVVDLQNDSSIHKKDSPWKRVNREDIYDDLMQWTKTRKLTSPFTLSIPFLN